MGIKQLLSAPADRVKQLERLLEQQQAQIMKLRAPRSTPSKSRPSNKGTGRPFLQVFCGDSHGACEEPAAVDAFVHDLAILKPREIYHVGDALDAGTFLAQHHVIGTVAQTEYTFEQDVLCANDLFDRMQKAAPKAKITLIEGNHDRRIETACVTWALQKKIDAQYLYNLFAPATVLNLAKRKIRFVRTGDYTAGCNISGTIRLEFDTLVQHGEAFAGPNATAQLLRKMGESLIHGHNHRLDVVYAETSRGVIGGWGAGCLCTRRPLWNMTKCTDWTHGYLVRCVQPGVGYTCFPVPIINGMSFLEPLARVMKL